MMIANSMKNCTLMTAKESEFSWVTGKDFVYMANSRYDGGSVYAILQDVEAPNSRYLYVMKVSAYGGVTQTKFMKWIIRGLKKQLVLQYILVYLGCCYAVGNTVYHFDMEGHQAEPIHLDGETITMLKFNLFMGMYPNSTMQEKLIVGSVKSGSG
ncbi:MAG: hypothetical protein ACLU4J_02945 [Butyricimonas paravirosa]